MSVLKSIGNHHNECITIDFQVTLLPGHSEGEADFRYKSLIFLLQCAARDDSDQYFDFV